MNNVKYLYLPFITFFVQGTATTENSYELLRVCLSIVIIIY